ncbi:acylphosphatase [Castellaniella caeni]
MSVFIEGKVQGVGFRAATVRRAHQLKLGGWVRNLADGRVEALLQGPHDAVDQMLSWLLQGPPLARVARVSHDEVQTERLYERFEQI